MPTGVRAVDSLAGQPAAEHVDPLVEGVEMRVVATAIETPSGRCTTESVMRPAAA